MICDISNILKSSVICNSLGPTFLHSTKKKKKKKRIALTDLYIWYFIMVLIKCSLIPINKCNIRFVINSLILLFINNNNNCLNI